MAEFNDGKLESFKPDDMDCCAAEWEDYKHAFQIYLDAKGLHEVIGRRKVGQFLR